MNKIKHVVEEVISGPTKRVYEDTNERGPREITFWVVKVKANSYGRIGTNTLTFDTKQEAEEVEPGYEFLA